MKKMKITIIAVILSIVFLAFLFFANYFYYIFLVEDDYGEQYSQTWISDDETITFTTKTKKGIRSQTWAHDGEITKDKKSIDIQIGFNYDCIVYGPDTDIVFMGDYNYNMFTNKIIVKLNKIYENYEYLFEDDTIVFTKSR